METLLVHPENEEQLAALKTFMEGKNIHFELQNEYLPEYVMKSVRRGIKQADSSKTISFEEFKSKHFKS